MVMFEKLRQEHQTRHARSQVELHAHAAADLILNRLAQHDEEPFPFDAQEPPKPMTPLQYAIAVGQRALDRAEAYIQKDIPLAYRFNGSGSDSSPGAPDTARLIFYRLL